jgi:hypothetical protein
MFKGFLLMAKAEENQESRERLAQSAKRLLEMYISMTYVIFSG